MNRLVTFIGLSAAMLLAPALALGQVWHDPFLNWDFGNYAGQTANDFDIILDTPNYVPPQVYTGFFPNFSTTTGDYDGDGDMDTRMRWTGRSVAPGQIAHIGAWMLGSGRIQDAYWTYNGQRIGPRLGISYERTRIQRRPLNFVIADVTMELSTTTAFIQDFPLGAELRNIRTFMDLPADMLGLNDINDSLNLSALAPWETVPSATQILLTDSPTDVVVGATMNIGPQWESLLVADVWVGSTVIGRFWNLNPQSPEPGTLMLLALSSGLLWRRRK